MLFAIACATAQTLAGFCEPSAIIAHHGGYLVGDNETIDRLFKLDASMRPAGEVAMAHGIDDIEALAAVGADVWVIGSHSRNKDGEARPMRQRIAMLGYPPVAVDFGELTGVNVEGAMVLGDTLWLGLRAPRALLVALTGSARDPAAVRSIARVVPLDLGGLAVRELVPEGAGFLVVAGPVADADVPHQLWRFASVDAAGVRLDLELPPSTEGLTPDGVYVTDGDGKPGRACKVAASWGRVVVR